MKNIKIIAVFLVAFMAMPFVSLAASHQDSGSHGHGDTAEVKHHGDHGEASSTAGDGSMMIVGSMVSKGVKGMAHLKDVSAVMASVGGDATHHFMIAFIDEATGEQIETGSVALKVTNPDAKVAEAVELMGMDGHFGVDLTLNMTGEYHFRLGTMLADGTKRKYHFHHVIK